MNILIKNAGVITCNASNDVLHNAFLGIKDGYIDFIDTGEEALRDFRADRVIDAKGKLVMPGFVNAHTHSGMTILRNFANDLALEDWLFGNVLPVEEKLTPEDIYWGTLLGITEMIKSGTTTFADMYLHMEEVAKAVSETGIRANLCRSPLKDSNKSAEDAVRCFEYFKKWNNSFNGRIKVYVEVHSVYLFDEPSLKMSAQVAKQINTGIHIHVQETLKECEDSIKKYGMSPAEICCETGIFDVPVIAAHCVHLSDRDMEIIKEKGVNVIHNPTSNLKLGSGIAKVDEMLKNGINVALGTDGAASNNNLNMIEEMHLAALIHKGVHMDPTLVDASTALKMATVNGAKALGFEGEIGEVSKGMKADLILIDMDKAHLCPVNDPVAATVYSAQGSDVDTVIIDGNIVMENRELKTIDEEKVKFNVKEIAKKVMK
ncbi:amidohydrolase [Acetivibrio straminisolvens]|uniref:5-methylthioadenosine/S-adenosylhomocysteine deaminase n=1 Tax=Acetivibrio straminisolvens JCM 21531 TaxID=1294263 RepID=W4VBH8_9FIRM|nr:amidohydrolase [Acetivibrio straminisolvens]GAE90153.1 S-adenosylhomocysteine deaminase [Acetivibrio straminisolvens JCM 21531]